jgi:hypothetical protein
MSKDWKTVKKLKRAHAACFLYIFADFKSNLLYFTLAKLFKIEHQYDQYYK